VNIFLTQPVAFTNTSTGSFTNSAWDFGDGNVATNASGANVTNTYASAGTYTVKLTVAGAGGSSTNTQTGYITVKPQAVLGRPVLTGGSFIFNGTNGPAGQPYSILCSTNVALALANWIPLVTNTFSSDGTYNYTNTAPTNKAGFFRLKSPP
jgi:PKD repeat protein